MKTREAQGTPLRNPKRVGMTPGNSALVKPLVHPRIPSLCGLDT